MGRGGYNGGSTLIQPGSDWFSKSKSKRKKTAKHKSPKRTRQEKEAELEFKIKLAAERLAQTQADFDAGRLRPQEIARPKTRPKKKKNGKKNRRVKNEP
jgi:hypothetical protein